MKILSINIPESYVNAIEKLIGENGIYPSRSELVRVAVREFIISRLRIKPSIEKLMKKNDSAENIFLTALNKEKNKEN